MELKARGIYDRFVGWHIAAMRQATPPSVPPSVRNAAHRGPAFLPWHREFLRRLELELQAISPSITLPYWDWSADAARPDPENAPVWAENFLGGDGDQNDIGIVKNGPFRFDPANPNTWTIVDENGNPAGGLRRMFAANVPTLPTQSAVDTALDTTPYDQPPWNTASTSSFRNLLEGWVGGEVPGLHNRVHVWVGGSMLPGTSPNDPIFYLNHCNVDRLWAEWQARHPDAPYVPVTGGPIGHNLNDRMVPWDTATTPASVLDYLAVGFIYDTLVSPLPTSGAPVEDAIALPGARRVYQLDIAARGRYQIETQGPTDVVMALYGPNSLTRLIAEDDDSGENTNARLISELQAGAYYVVVRHARPTETGGFRIVARTEGEPPVGEPPGPEPITVLTLNAPPLQASIGQAGEVDRYRFEVPALGTYTLQTEGPTDVVMALYGPGDPQSLVTQDDDSGQDFNAKITSRLSAGTYFVEVRHYSAQGGGAYRIFVRGQTQDMPALNVDGPPVQGSLEADNESDLYRFTLVNAGNYTVETTGDTDTFLTLFGPDSQTAELARDDDSGFLRNSRITTQLGPGVYYARVRHYRPTGRGDYAISVRGA